MALPIILAMAAAWWIYHRQTRPGTGPGASAEARARQLRTPLVRLADALGIDTRAGRQARNWKAGAIGEKRAAARLAQLTQQGWTLRYDLALPPGEGTANVDALAISPNGHVFVLDPKMMASRYPVTVRVGRLWHGDRDVTARVTSTRREAEAVSRALGVPVTPIVAIEHAPLVGPHGRPATELALGGVRIVPAEVLPAVLREAARIPAQRRAADLVAAADRALPPYTRR
ncbi:nuclease-related domain-containing protein [Streptomyces sp. H27-H5]|uniref:nuclease-related domain-containing protein n=1 Tax=Streptomyces sp. H27-H5 TaxID=2996460 RepID=UPI002271B9FB|nr:nuclease-related domain-containing protein [Streptomyces sp. H27-H5]MCY0957711.1 nuclease-related domain-containing protein [Streptomyces sp. H27-H5]